MFSVEENKIKKNSKNKKLIYLIPIILIIIGIILIFYLNHNNDYNNIKKDQTKDFVYTRYKRNIEGSKTKVPIININSNDVSNINSEIVDNMNNFLKEEYNVCDYKYSINKNILSVVLIMINNNTDTTPLFSFKTYNIDLETKNRLSNQEILKLYNTNEVQVSNSIKNTFKEYYNDEIKKGYIDKNECDYNCFIKWRNIEDYIDKVEYYIDYNKLYVYKEFNPYSVFQEEDYYDLDSFKFYIKD